VIRERPRTSDGVRKLDDVHLSPVGSAPPGSALGGHDIGRRSMTPTPTTHRARIRTTIRLTELAASDADRVRQGIRGTTTRVLVASGRMMQPKPPQIVTECKCESHVWLIFQRKI
jgi:hypothetical protein